MSEKLNSVPVDRLDKANIIQDHPEKYLMPKGDQSSNRSSSARPPPSNTGGHFYAEVISNDRITPEDHWQDVRQLVLNVPLDQGGG